MTKLLLRGGYDTFKQKVKDGVMQYGVSPSAIANPDIKWEESETDRLWF